MNEKNNPDYPDIEKDEEQPLSLIWDRGLRNANNAVNTVSAGFVSLDGIIAPGAVIPFIDGEISEQAQGFSIIFLIHQAIHNFLTLDAPPNRIKGLQMFIGEQYPLDGIAAGIAAYFYGGFIGALAFGLAHWLIHPVIVSNPDCKESQIIFEDASKRQPSRLINVGEGKGYQNSEWVGNQNNPFTFINALSPFGQRDGKIVSDWKK